MSCSNFSSQSVLHHQPPLSVIVANFNNELYIRDCIDSILNQTYKELEIIILDDGSTDSSSRIIRGYETKYPAVVKAIFSPVNRGVVSARHEAISQANSEYITTLDSDDYYYDDQKLQKEMDLIRRYKEKNNLEIIAYSNIVFVNGNKTLMGIWGNPGNIKQGKVFYEIITRACMIPRDFIMRRDAYFEVGGYDERFPIYEDWDLKIRLAKKYEFYYTGINGIAYRRHGTGLSSIPVSQNIKWLKRVFKKNSGHLDRPQKKTAVQAIRCFTRKMKTNQHKRKEDK